MVEKRLSDVVDRIQRSERSKPKVFHHDRLRLYKGSAPPTWHHDKLVQEEDLHANEPKQGQDNDD